MPGRLFLTTPLDRLAEISGMTANIPPDPPRMNISPGQDILTLTAEGWRRMRWGLIPTGRKNARGRPVMETIVNARSETVFDKSAFDGAGRAVVPADGWYEWTGPARRKTAHRLSDAAGAPLWFAAIFDVWTAPGGLAVPQVATITCEPNTDVAPIHHRMGALLEPDQLMLWLTADEATARGLLKPWPDGRLRVEDAGDVDWDAP